MVFGFLNVQAAAAAAAAADDDDDDDDDVSDCLFKDRLTSATRFLVLHFF